MNLDNIDKSMLDYWKKVGVSEKDFYCRDCGKPLFDLSVLEKIRIFGKYTNKNGYPNVIYKESKQHYVESENERWAVVGRYLSGKHYQRKICWDCFFKKLPNLILEKRDEIKNKWMIKLRKNDLHHIPVSSQSAAFYFSLIFDISEEDLKREMDKFVTSTPEFFKRKFGKDWESAYNNYRKVQAKAGCTLEYFIEKLGSEEGKKKYEEVCANKGVTLKNCIRKYGKIEGKKQFDEYCKKQEYAGCKLEYFIEKYGKEEGAKKYYEINHQKAMTLENMIRVHGLEEGKIVYQQWIDKAIANHIGYSKVSQELFEAVDKKLGDLAKNSKWATKNGEAEIEINISDYAKKWARPDYVLGNKIIEFNGDYWHCNPKFYNAEDFVPRFGTTTAQSVKEVWESDYNREQEFKRLGYEVLTVWEDDYYANPVKEIDRCVDFLNK